MKDVYSREQGFHVLILLPTDVFHVVWDHIWYITFHAIWERDTPSSKTFFAQGILQPRTLDFKADVCTNRVVTILSERLLAVYSHQKQPFPHRLSRLSALTIIGTSQDLLFHVSIELMHLRRKVPYKIQSRNILPTSTSNAYMGKIGLQKLGWNKDIYNM